MADRYGGILKDDLGTDLGSASKDKYGGELITSEPTDKFGGVPVIDDPVGPIIKKEPEGRTLGSTLSDVGVTTKKGVLGLAEAATGLADIVTPGIDVGGFLEEKVGFVPKRKQAEFSKEYSPAQQEAFRRVEEKEGFVPTALEMIKQPSTIAHGALESVPMMLAGGGIARGLTKAVPAIAKALPGVTGKLIPSAIGEGTVAAGSQAEGIRQEKGVLSEKDALISLASGIGTGAFNLIGGRLAAKFGFADADSMLAGLGTGKKSGNVFTRIIQGGISEGIFEELPQSAQEQIWQNAALDKPLLENVSEAAAAGMMIGAGMGAGANVASELVSRPPTDQESALSEADTLLDGISPPTPVSDLSDEDLKELVDVENTQLASAIENKKINNLPVTPQEDLFYNQYIAEKGKVLSDDEMMAGIQGKIATGEDLDQNQLDYLDQKEKSVASQDKALGIAEKLGLKTTLPVPEADVAEVAETVAEKTEREDQPGTDEVPTTETAPLETELITDPDSIAQGQEVNVDPTEAMKESETYKMAHVKVDGLDISIETPLGVTRSGEDADGNKWSQEMKADYGRLKGTVGFDKDHVDTFIKPGYKGGNEVVHVVNQKKKDGSFDEHKVVQGADSQEDALKIYNSNYEPGWDGADSVVEMPLDEFKTWVKSDAPKKGAVKGADLTDFTVAMVKDSVAIAEGPTPKTKGELGKVIKDQKVTDKPERRKTDSEGKRIDRRKDSPFRKKVSEMSREEMAERLLKDKLTGLDNERGFWETFVEQNSTYVARLDMDNLHDLNEVFGYSGSNQLIKRIAEKADELGIYLAREKGDEFLSHGDDLDILKNDMDRLTNELDGAIIKVKAESGKLYEKTGVGVSYGIEQSLGKAEAQQKLAKERRLAEGKRIVGRQDGSASELPGVVEITPEGREPEGGETRDSIPERQEEVTPPTEKEVPTVTDEIVPPEAEPEVAEPPFTVESYKTKSGHERIVVKGKPSEIRAALAENGFTRRGSNNSKLGGITFSKDIRSIVENALALTPSIDVEKQEIEPVPQEIVEAPIVKPGEEDVGKTETKKEKDIEKPKKTTKEEKKFAKKKEVPKGPTKEKGEKVVEKEPVKQVDITEVTGKEDVQDVGEKLYGSRADKAAMQALFQQELSDDDIRKKPLSKIWPKPKIKDLDNSFSSAFAVAARAEIPNKPRKRWKLDRWVKMVQGLRNISREVLDGTIDQINVENKLKGTSVLDGFYEKVKMYREIDKEFWYKIKDIGNAPNSYRYGTRTETGYEEIPSPFASVNGKSYQYKKSFHEVIPEIEKDLQGDTGKPRLKFEVRGRGSSYFINKQGDSEYRHLKTFDSSKEAIEYRNTHYGELVDEWDKVKARDNVRKADTRKKENLPRTGKDHRKGKNVTAKEFMDTFGFRGVEFGKWVSQGKGKKERQGMVNAAYDALFDLAGILNIPTDAISLNGSLGLGFGSRGHGWASAHYEPDTFVINLTKPRGAGSLAHEWFHALDNYFQLKRGDGKKTDADFITYRPETVYRNKSNGVTITGSLFKQVESPEEWVREKDGVRPKVAERFVDVVDRLNESDMATRSKRIDKGKRGYWSSIIEMAARAFETYAISKMQDDGYQNDYLANVVSLGDFKRNKERYPYLTEEENGPVNEAFDALFSEIKTRKTDKGVELYSRATGTAIGETPENINTELKKFLGKEGFERTTSAGNIVVVGKDGDVKDKKSKEPIRSQDGKILNGYVNKSTGQVTIIAENNKSNEVAGKLQHEFFHRMMVADPEFKGQEFIDEFDGLRGKDARVDSAFEDAIKAEGKDADPELIKHEAFAYYLSQEANQKQSLYQKVISAVKAWLKRNFGNRFVKKMSADDLRALAIQSIRQFEKKGVAKVVSKAEVNEFAQSLKMSTDEASDNIANMPDFKTWFGDSKVVDENGEPLVVYHGTRKPFTEFKRDYSAQGVFWFSDSKEDVRSGEAGALSSKEIIPVYLSAKKLAGWDEYEKFFLQELVEKGYEGVKLDNNYIVFEPNQIKSIHNTKWNPSDPDIFRSVSESQPTAPPPESSQPEKGIPYTEPTVEQETPESAYLENRQFSGNLKAKTRRNIDSILRSIKKGADKYLGAISTRLGNINEKLKHEIRRLDQNIALRTAEEVKAVEGLLRKAKGMSRDDFRDWDLARKNGAKKKINELVKKYDMKKEYDSYRKVLNNLRKDGLDSGLDIGWIDEYAPRVLKDSTGFLNAIGKGNDWPRITRALQKRAAEMGVSVSEMTPEMKADLVSNMILGGNYGLGGPSNSKERVIKQIPPELNQFYMNSDGALMSYIHSMRKTIEQRKFFGKVPDNISKAKRNLHTTQTTLRKEIAKDSPDQERIQLFEDNILLYRGMLDKYRYGYRDYTENIGQYVLEKVMEGNISPEQENELIEILEARFHERGTRGLIQAYKHFSYIDTMGSPISALTQIGDLAWSMYENGLIPTFKNAFKSAINKSKITKEDVGAARIAQEFADSDTLGSAVSKVFKLVGLEKIDSIGKETLLNASLEKFQKRAKKQPDALSKEIEPIFEKETESVIQDLQNEEITDNVKYLVYSKLLDFQPVALSEMPEQYLRAGNGRVFYMLKTFTLKQFDVYRREVYQGLASGDKKKQVQAMRNLVSLSMMFVIANAGADELKDFVLNRKTSLSDRVMDNILRLFGVSKFVTWKARTEGVGSAMARQILPPFKFIDSVTKDIISAGDDKGLEITKSIPLLGKLAYWHMGRGRSKRVDLAQRRLSREKKKLNKIKEQTQRNPALRKKYAKQLRKLRKINRFQGKLNKQKRIVNRLIGEEDKGKDVSDRLERLMTRRSTMIEEFLTRL